MLTTGRVAIEEHVERRILENTMRPALRQTRAPSPRQLPTDHDYAVSTREYQSDQPSQKILDRLLALSLAGSPVLGSANPGRRFSPFPSYASLAERFSLSRVRCAARYPRAPLTAPVRSANPSCPRRKGEERKTKTNTNTNIVRLST